MRLFSTVGLGAWVVVGAAVLAGPAQGALVSGGYVGTIVRDDGVGVVGQEMVVEFTYDDATPASFTGSFTSYDNPLVSMMVTIGPNTWTWINTAYSYASLQNDDVILLYVGPEDRLEVFAYEFTGPDYVANVSDESYSLSIYFHDEEPTGSPDGLASEALPAEVPDPADFQYTAFERPLIAFSFIAGDFELGRYYQIEATNIRLIPEPTSLGAMGLGALALLRRRRA